MMSNAIYAGSFDPFTKGHWDIVDQALKVFDRVTLGVGWNPSKKRMFSIQETTDLINKARAEREDGWKIDVTSFDGALVYFAEREKKSAIIRGLRQVSDFNDEFIQHGVNSRASNIPIVYFICHNEFLHVSSSTAKMMIKVGLDVSWLVDKETEYAMRRLWEQ
jgi:pantetheine-phosphate adenylyltransferase